MHMKNVSLGFYEQIERSGGHTLYSFETLNKIKTA